MIYFDFSYVDHTTSLANYIGKIVEKHEKLLKIPSTDESSVVRLGNVLEAYKKCYVLIDEYDDPI